MYKGSLSKTFFPAIACIFLLSSFVAFGSEAQTGLKGNIIGFLYDRDGTTPLEGAVVKFKSLTSGTIYESTKSDTYGIFRVQAVESGVYTYGVTTERGGFNADSILGFKVSENETAKLSISINPYEEEVAAAVSEIYKEQSKGEALVGVIADFNAGTRMAQVEVMRGLLRIKDKIHTKGESTDFYQNLAVMRVGNSAARHLLKGQVGTVQLEQKAVKGDLVFVVPTQHVFPFFLVPAGVAAVIAGNQAVTYNLVKISDSGSPVSAKRND